MNATRMRTGLAATLALTGMVLLVGCIIYPTGQGRNDFGHQPIDNVRLGLLKNDKTDRTGVIEQLGKPTLTLEDGRILVYSWTTESRTKVVNLCGKASSQTLASEQNHFLLAQFDESGLLKRTKIFHGGHLATTQPAGIDDAIVD